MKYYEVQTILEQFVKDNWTETSVAYENAEFNPDVYSEYLKCNIVFGDTAQRSVTRGCYRVTGVMMMMLNVRPSVGMARMTELANTLTNLLISVIVRDPAQPGTPAVNLKVPALQKNPEEVKGWVKGMVSCPFYYDFTSEN